MLFGNTTSSTPRFECIQHWELIKINPLSCGMSLDAENYAVLCEEIIYMYPLSCRNGLGCRNLCCLMCRNHLHVPFQLQKWDEARRRTRSWGRIDEVWILWMHRLNPCPWFHSREWLVTNPGMNKIGISRITHRTIAVKLGRIGGWYQTWANNSTGDRIAIRQ